MYQKMQDNLANDELKIKIAECLLRLSKYQDAIELLKTCKDVSADVKYWLGVVYWKLGNLSAAITHCNDALQIFLQESSAEMIYDYYGSRSNTQNKELVKLGCMTAEEILDMVK